MKLINLSAIILLITLYSCGNKATSDNATNQMVLETISVNDFEAKLNAGDVQLLDVRTAEEFAQGHLKGAKNVDVNSSNFDTEVSSLDKTKSLLVYCLSGGRSSAAANRLSEMGFVQVFNMDGGIMSWEASGKPLETAETSAIEQGMTQEEFYKKIGGNKLVLVDFNAKWCAPCKKMLPMLEDLAKQNADKFTLLRIDVEENKTLAKELNVTGVPILHIYESGKLKWTKVGLADEKTIKEALGII